MRQGYTVIAALPELHGVPWCAQAQALITALRPSSVCVVRDDEAQTCDARTWRVTVYLRAERIERIEQEVEVDLPDGVAHGHDLNVQLERLRKR